ncbi:hypothetical protein AVEN_252548-1 [Araneus ventricosus]|uniref:Uncharacterized protein n=1 Tax=Araneus ventricosus TaxID=182803 RepID=A0A4Y2AR25_ARAVE|nr:hypothetical protein AVEN_252548-1 [Araneus ventricosus]
MVLLKYSLLICAPKHSSDAEGVDFDRMATKPNPYRTLYQERMQKQIVMEMVTFHRRKYSNEDELNASVQKLRKRIGEWYNSNLHQPTDSGMIKILGTYNQCLRERGYDSEFELNDDGVIYSDFSSAESVASDLSELNPDST